MSSRNLQGTHQRQPLRAPGANPAPPGLPLRMRVIVEPENGTELERLITALLNATGVVHRFIETAQKRPGIGGLEIIGAVAERLHGSLAPLAELRSDDELAEVTQVLAEATLMAAADLE